MRGGDREGAWQITEGNDVALPLHDGVPEIDYDVDIGIMQLPSALRITLDTLPAAVPYIYMCRMPGLRPGTSPPVWSGKPAMGTRTAPSGPGSCAGMGPNP